MGKNLDFILTRIGLALKENVEYRMNLWSAFIINIVVSFVSIFFYLVYFEVGVIVEGWNFYDVVLYFFLFLASSKALHSISLKNFNIVLLRGIFSNILVLPINSFLFSIFYRLRGPVLVIFPILLFIIGVFVFLENSYSNYIFFILWFIYSFLWQGVFNIFFQSFAFFIKNIDFLISPFFNINKVVRIYTPSSFDGFSTKFLFYSLPSIVVSYFGIEILKGNFDVLFEVLPYLVFIQFIFILVIWLNWRYGLKNYEAFS